MVATPSRLSVASIALSLLAANAGAGTVDPSDRVERIGGSQASRPVAILAMPGMGRELVALSNGEIRLASGNGLVNELLVDLDVAQGCAGDGLLDAEWMPAAPGSELLVSYTSTGSPKRLTLARLTIGADRSVTGPAILYQTGASQTCTNLGGAIGFTNDGKILFGSGDQGRPTDAQVPTNTNGKILRLETTGSPAAGNILPGSAVYNIGIRNPVAIETDPAGSSWFLDAGDPAGTAADELNFVSTDPANANFGWPDGTGALGRADRLDPPAAWSPAIGATDFVPYRESHLAPPFAGDLVVVGSTGRIARVDTNDGSVVLPTVSSLYTQDAAPMAFVAARTRADGFVYLALADGSLWRYRSDRGAPLEPSADSGIVPMTVRKIGGGPIADPMVEIAIEKQPGAIMYGPYRGDLASLDPVVDGNGDTVPDGFNHPVLAGDGAYLCVSTPSRPSDALLCAPGVAVLDDPADAYARFLVASSFLAVDRCTPPATCGDYILASARSQARESAVGRNSFNVVTYGGDVDLGCPCPAGSVPGPKLGQCVDSGDAGSSAPWTLAWGREGAGNTIGPVTFDETWDCNVILLDLSEDWCGPCHFLADELEPLYVQYKDAGFTLLTVISEGRNGGFSIQPDVNNATQATIDSWIATHGSTNPVLLDELKRVMFQYMDYSATNPCGPAGSLSWPRSMLFDVEGNQVEVFCGVDPAAIRAGVERELREAGYIP